MPKKLKKELIPCPVDIYCRNWDPHNECCQDDGCRASGFKKITREDISFYQAKKDMEIESRILSAETRVSS